MTKNFQKNVEFSKETFEFLKKSLSSGEKQEKFQPRGPNKFIDGDWTYSCNWEWDITKFEGHEKILFKKEIIFIPDFLGGVILDTN